MSTICPQCHSPLSTDQACPQCLLQLGLSSSNAKAPIIELTGMPTPADLAKYFPQLEIQGIIGHGGMGAIYRARQTSLERDVAIKLIAQDISQDPMFCERFEREAKSLAKLSHPNIVTVYDFGQTANSMAYLIMEFVDGINMREAIASMSFETSEVLDYISKMCQALQYAHDKGIIHRDIKPENVLLGEDGSLKIVDFGIAKTANDPLNQRTNLTRTRQVLGTPHYVAPEQIEAPELVDHRIDLYSLGVLFYELLTGKLPVGHFEPPSMLNPRVSPQIDAIAIRALQRQPARRFQSANEFLAAIQSCQAENIPLIEPIRTPTSNQRYSVPFSFDSSQGMVNVRGMVHASNSKLTIEFRNLYVGLVRGSLQSLEIPREKIMKVELKPGAFRPTLTIIADAISTLGGFPESESGCIRMGIKRRDYELARRVVSVLALDDSPTPPTAESAYRPDTARSTLAILLIFLGLFNTGLLAITSMLLSELEGSPKAAGIVACAILLGPLATLQMVAGIIYLITGIRSVAQTALIASMLPITPLCLAGLPLGVWGLKWLTHDEIVGLPNQPAARKSFGATTLMWIQEKRVSRTISFLETAGCLIFVAALCIYGFHCYPARIDYRYPDTLSNVETMHQAIKARLSDVSGVHVEVRDAQRVRIHAWQFQKAEVERRLAITTRPRFVFIFPATAGKKLRVGTPSSNTSLSKFPVDSGVFLTDEAIENGPLQKYTYCYPVDFESPLSIIANVRVASAPPPENRSSKGDQDETQSASNIPLLTVKLTAPATQLLGERLAQFTNPSTTFTLPNEANEATKEGDATKETTGKDANTESNHSPVLAIGLVIDDLIVGVAKPELGTGRTLTFELSQTPNSKLTENNSQALVAAFFGPDLPSPIELITNH